MLLNKLEKKDLTIESSVQLLFIPPVETEA